MYLFIMASRDLGLLIYLIIFRKYYICNKKNYFLLKKYIYFFLYYLVKSKRYMNINDLRKFKSDHLKCCKYLSRLAASTVNYFYN